MNKLKEARRLIARYDAKQIDYLPLVAEFLGEKIKELDCFKERVG